MRLSKFFLPTLKENPKEAIIPSHRLMLRSGMIRMHSSGIYSWLPLGVKILKNIENIIRNTLIKSGCQELIMPCIQSSDLWKISERYNDYGEEMLKMNDRHGTEILFAPTAEEIVTDIFKNNIYSHKNLPIILFQSTWKFRDEIRPRYGTLRGREFLMKDAYSFDMSEEDSRNTYFKMFDIYLNIFKNLGIKVIPVKAENGPIGGDLSHEFHVIASNGESNIFYQTDIFDYIDNNKTIDHKYFIDKYASAEEKHDPNNLKINKENITKSKGIEIGHIFNFSDKYTKSLNVELQDKLGNKIYPKMGSYGIGISRLVAAIIEAHHDEKGIIWPKEIAPFKASIINLDFKDENCTNIAENIYKNLNEASIECLIDDTNSSRGNKFANNNLIGSPIQIIISNRNINSGNIEFVNRITGENKIVNLGKIIEITKNYFAKNV